MYTIDILWWIIIILALAVIIIGIAWASSAGNNAVLPTSPEASIYILAGSRPVSTAVASDIPILLSTSTGAKERVMVSNGSRFVFHHRFRSGETYTVSVDGIAPSYVVTNGSGTFSDHNISDILVKCA